MCPNCAPTVSKEDVCPECASTVPQLCPNRFCLNCAPSNFLPRLCPSCAREFSILCPNCASTVLRLCLARLPNCRKIFVFELRPSCVMDVLFCTLHYRFLLSTPQNIFNIIASTSQSHPITILEHNK